MLREAVNLSPLAKPMSSPQTHSPSSDPEHEFDSDQSNACDVPAAAHRSSSHQCMAEGRNSSESKQGQETGKGAAVLREAYREMLLQQQARHCTELQRQQAKYQRQLKAQVSLLSCCSLSHADSGLVFWDDVCMSVIGWLGMYV